MREIVRCHVLLTPRSRGVPAYASPSPGRLPHRSINRQGLNVHGTQARQEERCRKPLAIDLAVDLVRQLINAQSLQATRQIFVGDSSMPHLRDQHLSGLAFPWLPHGGLVLVYCVGWGRCHAFRKCPLLGGSISNKRSYTTECAVLPSQRSYTSAKSNLLRP